MTDDRWWWWAGLAGDVDADGIYEHGGCETREEVIGRILGEIDEGDVFVVVEAQFDTESEAGGEDYSPFKATRNQEYLIKRDGLAQPAPPVDA